MSAVFRRLFIVFKPNFVLLLSPLAISATPPSQRLAAFSGRHWPGGFFVAGHRSRRNVRLFSRKRVGGGGTGEWVVGARALWVAGGVPAPAQEPAAQGPVIKSQVSLVNLFATVRDK